jgi:hydroxyacylglutathione hydrolase
MACFVKNYLINNFTMKIEQFEDKGLSHYAYAVLSECEKKVVLIDPSRDVSPYLDFARQHEAQIIGIVETHPHADFVSGHLELHQVTGANVYCSKRLGAVYPHRSFDDGQVISYGKIKLKAWNTPGHSPDSISVVLEYGGKDTAVFTGDTLFIGDCGRPDLRETAGHLTAGREELASQMYQSLRGRLMTLDNDVVVYPAHGAGTLCGKALSEANHSTIGAEKVSNWSLQEIGEQDFVKKLTADQPFVPGYFPHAVEVNKKGAAPLTTALTTIAFGRPITDDTELDQLDKKVLIIDARPSDQYKAAHLSNSVNCKTAGSLKPGWVVSLHRESHFTFLRKTRQTFRP